MARQSKLTSKRKEQIIELLSKGATDKDVCAVVGIDESTFYNWLKDGREKKSQSKIEFLEAVSRARAEARLVAINSLRLGMLPSQVVVDATETVRETRLNSKGQPYSYERTETRRQITQQPGDWRAGESFLKRRDPEHWSERLVISISPQDLEVFQILGMEPSEAVKDFLEMLHQIAARKTHGVVSTP